MTTSDDELIGLTADRIRQDIIEILADPRALDDSGGDLIAAGLDSLKVMRLAARWRAGGADVRFAELFERPRLEQWEALVVTRGAAAPATPAAPAGSAAPVATGDGSEPFPLAPMQHAYWAGRQDSLELGGVATHFYAELDGDGVDPQRLERAVRRLLERHGMLRARVLDDGRQQILPVSPWPGLRVDDLRDLDEGALAERLAARRDALSHRRMDVAAGEVLDLGLSLLPGGRTRVHLNIDMLVADAYSFRVIVADLSALYDDPDAELRPLGYSYPEYLAERVARPRPGREAAEQYWAGRIPTMPRAPQLPLAVAPELLGEHRVTRRHHWLPPADRAVLLERARAHGLTLSVTFAAAFARVLAAWSAEPDFLLNVPVFDREQLHPDVDGLVGDFSSLLVLAVHTDGAGDFVTLARRLQDRLRQDTAHGDFSGLEVLRGLARHDGAARTLAPVVFTGGIGLGDLFGSEASARLGRLVWSISQAPQVWLDHQVTEHEDGLLLNWDAVEEIFPAGLLDDMFGAYRDLLGRLVDDADWAALSRLPLPPAQARRRAAINSTDGPEHETVLHRPFFATAADDPGRTALVGLDGTTVSYGELAARAERVAALLLAGGGRAGDAVAVTLERGPAQVAAVLGVLRAGMCFVPVGLDQPASRRAAMHEVGQVRLVLTDAASAAWLRAEEDLPVLAVEDADGPGAPVTGLPAVPADPEATAYLIFTSGSTGVPKCVAMTHRAARNTIEDIAERWAVGPADRGLAVSALVHDWAVFDLFTFLGTGGSLVVLDEAARREPAAWAAAVERAGVTVWTGVPALFDMLMVAGAGRLASLRLVLLGGDWLGLDLWDRLQAEVPGCRMVALGGATEVGIHSTWHEVTAVPAQWRSVPYGAPLRNQQVRVVAPDGSDRPDEVPGELWLGGVGVGVGYHGDPGRTAQRFVEADGRRWYRTGDLCRYRADGTLELLGRTDLQVKLLGRRIELGEVETALRSFPGVRQAVAAVVGDPPGLAAAVTGLPAAADGAGAPLDTGALLAHLRTRLPEDMVPRQVLVLDDLPLNPNAKVDRAAVAGQLARAQRARVVEPPRGETETRVAALWSRLLGGRPVGRADSFFALGGDSLSATRLLVALREEGFESPGLGALFATPVLSDFAAGLSRGGPAAGPAPLPADPEHRHDPFPPTAVQQAYWLGRRPEFRFGGVGSTWYWEFDAPGLDVERLEKAWNQLVRRHEMLRAVFDDQGAQRVLPEVPHYPVNRVDGSPATVAAARDDLAHRVFDTATWPLFDLTVLRGPEGDRLGIALDFIVLDALSIMIVFSELAELYADPAAALPPIGVSFRDLILAPPLDPDRERTDAEYWLERLPELPGPPQLPTIALPEGEPARFTRREFRLPAPEWDRLRARCAEAGLTASAVIATVFGLVLRDASAVPEHTLNMTLFDRPARHPDVSRVVGDFTSLLLVADRPAAGETFAEAAARLQRQMWADMDHSSFSGIAVLRELARRSESSEALMPVVFTSTLGLDPADGAPRGLDLPFGRYAGGLSQTPQVWLDHQVLEDAGGLVLNWDAVEGMFPAGLLDHLFGAYRELLERVARAGAWDTELRPAPAAGQLEVRRRMNDTAAPVSGRLLHEGFLARAAAEPSRIAVIDGGSDDPAAYTAYGELADLAGRIAGELIAAGVRPASVVAVTLPPGAARIAAVLGILQAGAVYLPLGAEQPVLRRARILRGSGASHLFTDRATAARDRAAGSEDEPSTGPTVRTVLVEDAAGRAPAEPVVVPDDTPAYVIYTSGSTGEPKGVVIAHAAAVNTVEDIVERFGVGPEDRVLAVSALDFDLSVFDVFGLLAAGGAVVTVPEAARRDAEAWVDLVQRHRVTVWNSVPTLLDMLLTAADGRPLEPLRLALVSGDWVGLDLRERLDAAVGGARLVALGGATEAAIWSNAYEVVRVEPHWTSVPYGFPLRNQCFRVVDAHGRDRPDWVPGELWIGGAGVAVGYLGDLERTAERFVTADGGRWYRTGDLGRYWPDGTLEFLGRKDNQVKVRGHRIELGEVEAVLEAHPAVVRAVVCAVGRNRLAALVVVPESLPDTAGLAAELTDHLARRLPEHMVPARIATATSLPLTANGKVDRAAVQARFDEEATVAAEPPREGVEAAVAQIWAELLGRPVPDRVAGFFSVGGDSLLATRLVQSLRRTFGVEISLQTVLARTTVAAQAAAVSAAADEASLTYEMGAL